MGAYDTTIGVLLIGIFFNTYLYGLVCAQFITYYTTPFNDPLWIKAFVTTLLMIDTAHSAIAIYGAWQICVTNFANPAILAVVGWPTSFTAIATAVVATISQWFLGYRIYRLTNNKILFGLVILISTTSGITGVIAGAQSWILWEVVKFGQLHTIVTIWLTMQTACDLLITGILSLVLSKSRTGFKRTDSIINRLIRGAIQTGLFASVFALGDLFSFLLHGDTDLYAMFAYPMGRIYTNTLLDTLNSRAALKQKDDMSSANQQNSSSALTARRGANPTQDSIRMNRIEVQTEVHTMHDGSSVPDMDTKYTSDEVFIQPGRKTPSAV